MVNKARKRGFSFFGTVSTSDTVKSLWTSQSNPFALRAVTQGVWLCVGLGRCMLNGGRKCCSPMRNHPSKKPFAMGRLDIIPDSHNMMCFFVYHIVATSTGKMMIHHWISEVHTPFSDRTQQRKWYVKNHKWVMFAQISTLIIALRLLLKYAMHREIHIDRDCNRCYVYASLFLIG